MLLGKLVISVSTAGIMLLAIQHFNIYDNHEISSLGVIGIVILMLAYIIAVVFLGNYVHFKIRFFFLYEEELNLFMLGGLF